jgi:hypothetical protein
MKMKAPPGAVSALIEGYPYEVVDGHVEARSEAHAAVLRVHGYKDAVTDLPKSDPEDEFDHVPDVFDEMKKAELVEYVEARGAEVVKPIKMAVLRAQARELAKAEDGNKED